MVEYKCIGGVMMELKKINSLILLSLLFSGLLFMMTVMVKGVEQGLKSFLIVFLIYLVGMGSIILATRLRKKVTPDSIYGASGSCGIGGCGTCASKDLCELDISKIDLT